MIKKYSSIQRWIGGVMKILVVVGSPRKKDSYGICKKLEDLGKDKYGMSFDYWHLGDLSIGTCKGCSLCFTRGEHLCPLMDEHTALIDALQACDGIIFSSPVYAYQVTGLMKNVIDRSAYLFHRPALLGKPAFIVTTTDGGGSKAVSKYLKMVLSGWGLVDCGCINIISPKYYPSHPSRGVFSFDEAYKKKQDRQMVKVMDKLYSVHNNPNQRPSFYSIMIFNALRSKTYTSEVDKAYWEEKGWMDKLFYSDVSLGLIKKCFAKAVQWIIHNMATRRKKNSTV